MIGCKVLLILGGILFAIGTIVGLLNLAMNLCHLKSKD